MSLPDDDAELDLDLAYEEASTEWVDSGEEAVWEPTTGDGLS